jgi:hypothetical protein
MKIIIEKALTQKDRKPTLGELASEFQPWEG